MRAAASFWRENVVAVVILLPTSFSEGVVAGAPNENIVQNHLNIALLNVF